MLCTFALLALFASVQGRAVNISNTWVLPEEGFPVFYRYFRDRISWYEADAVCQFHHANLVTVDTTAQYDAVRAYLKELDISSAVWVGLIRSNPDGDFTWTDYRGLSGDGYWSSAPDARAAPLCAAANPAADYRWEARACGGPTVASFICELPVPQWALGNEGCMVRALPALTILYLPESAAVQLTADCGLAGVKRVQCTGNVKREDLLKDLSCAEDDEVTTIPSLTSSLGNTNSWASTTEAIITEQDTTTSEVTTDENVTTEHEDDINQSSTVTSTTAPSVHGLNLITNLKTTQNYLLANKLNRINLDKDLDMMHNNNLQSNYIPKIVNEDTFRGGNYLTNEQLEKIEDERHMQHKMLHEEIARIGNIENIFTQPTDHFVPPLVMAKAKISDDMTVLSLQEKHAQQLAEQHFSKQGSLYGQNDHVYHSDIIKSTTVDPKIVTLDKEVITTTKNYDDSKKDFKIKPSKPKKYNEKLYDPKSKSVKGIDSKSIPVVKPTDQVTTQTEIASKQTETTSMSQNLNDGPTLELTVTLKEKPEMHDERTFFTNFSGDVSRLEVIKNSSLSNETEIKLVDMEATEDTTHENPTKKFSESTKNITLNNDIIKITIISDSHTTPTPTTFEVTTKASIIQDTTPNNLKSYTNKEVTDEVQKSSKILPSTHFDSTENYSETKPAINVSSEIANEVNDTLVHVEFIDNIPSQVNEEPIVTSTQANNSTGIQNSNMTEIRATDVSNHEIKTDTYNDETHDEFGVNNNSSETIDDFNSPLLSGANEPLHRPARTRRPQQPPRNKFNPFRILG